MVKESLTNLQKAKPLAPLICSFGNDLFLMYRRHLGTAYGVLERPPPLLVGTAEMLPLFLRRMILLTRIRVVFSQILKGLVYTKMGGCGLSGVSSGPFAI